MVSALRWRTAYRIIPSLFPPVGLFDGVADPADLQVVLELEAATNPRVLDEVGELHLVRPEERIAGPGTTPVMAAFTHTMPSRFSDGSFGVLYASHDEETAIVETAHHRGRFLRDAGFDGDERLDMRVYTLSISGRFDDLRKVSPRSKLYDPNSYAYSQTYARRLFDKNVLDGAVYRSVRREGGECVAVFRPRRVSNCRVLRHLEYRFENCHLIHVINAELRERQ